MEKNRMENETIIILAADIVSAHVSNNKVTEADVVQLIQSVHGALADAVTPPVAAVPQEPAVPIRTSVKPAAIACLECGRKMKMLKRHLKTDHGLSPDEYRAKWKLGADYPVVAPDYAAVRAEMARKFGLGRKPGTGKQAAPAKKPRTSRTRKAPSAKSAGA
jgi:predicted transcriptional regulator